MHVGVEIGLSGLIKAGVKFIFDKVNWENRKESNDENYSAATNTGDRSAASVEGKESIAIATGIEGKARGTLGCWIVVTEWFQNEEDDWYIKDVKSTKVDGEKIKADTYYMLKDGEFIECEED